MKQLNEPNVMDARIPLLWHIEHLWPRTVECERSHRREHMNNRYILCFMVIQLTAAPVLADTCAIRSSMPATNRVHVVNGFAGHYILTNLKTGKQHSGPLPLIDSHAHLQFFLSDDGKHFAVLDESAGHRLTNRFMIYTLSGKLVASLGVQDLLTKDEQGKIVRSISHMYWLKRDSATGSYGNYVAAENAVCLTTFSDRKVLISLVDGRLITKKP